MNIKAEEWAELMAKVKQANKRIENQPADDDAIPNNWQEEQTRDIEEMNEDRIKHPFARCWDDQTDEEVQTEHWNKERV